MGNAPNADKLSYMIQFEAEQNSDGEQKLTRKQLEELGLELDSEKTITALRMLAGEGNGGINPNTMDQFTTYQAALEYYRDNSHNYDSNSIYTPNSIALKSAITLAVLGDREKISSDHVLDDIVDIAGSKEVLDPLEPKDRIYL